jgi:arylsulfatase A-like enzyme
MRKLIYSLLFGILTGCTQLKVENKNHQAPPPPNIIYILADDLGYGDISYLNKDSKIPTPHLDGLAQEGIHFTDAHSNSAVCTPTRYGILTGRYAFRTSLTSGVLWGYSPALIEPSRVTVASFLKQNGYETACIGKWHLGLDWARKDPTRIIPEVTGNAPVPPDFEDNVNYEAVVKGGPADHGFDYSYIIPASLDMSPYLYLRNGKAVQAPTAYTAGKDQKVDGRGVFWREGKMSPDFDFYGVLPTFIGEAVQFVEEKAAQKGQKPFFLYLPLAAPHTPWVPGPVVANASGAGTYGDFVVMVDQMVGKVLAALDKNGLKENTLIIFTSDNGADWNPTDIENSGHHANHIFRGRKADIYEAGHRIPFIARWPGTIPAGASSDQTICTTDLLATVAGLLDQPLPEGAGEDSYNMLPAFKGEQPDHALREATIHHSLHGHFAIRKGPWKLTTSLGSGGFSQPQAVEPKEGQAPQTLYNLANDPGETMNLYLAHPEVVKELAGLLEQYQQQGYSRPKPVL